MTISALRITDFRNLASVDISSFQQRLNIICGNNGSGKTSLLEAIYYLGLGRSFRSSAANRLIRYESNKLSVFAQILNNSEQRIPIGVERDTKGNTKSRISEQDVSSVAEIAAHLPILMINSHSHQMLESGPLFRRKYLDWGLFYHSKKFLSIWRNFERVLKQRNITLKEKRPRPEIEVWTNELIKYGLELDTLRREYIQLLTPHMRSFLTVLLPNIADFEITYTAGWPISLMQPTKVDLEEMDSLKNAANSDSYSINNDPAPFSSHDYSRNSNVGAEENTTDLATEKAIIANSLASALAKSYFEELRYGHTQYGPHRADLEITINGVPVKHILSRGQQKLLICAMILAQGKLLMTHTNKGLVYLIDDLPSELDMLSRTKLISLLAQQEAQIFITAIDSDDICQLIDQPMDVFHVEQGKVSGSITRS